MHQATLPAAFALGVVVGLCEFPCTGGPYLMILGLLHDRGTYTSGLGISSSLQSHLYFSSRYYLGPGFPNPNCTPSSNPGAGLIHPVWNWSATYC